MQLALFGCARCGDPIGPGAVSSRYCDPCMRVFLTHSVVGREHWSPHPDHTGVWISNLGNVRGPRGTVLKSYPHGKGGYPSVTIDGKQRRVHHLVLETYIGPRPQGCEACHYDDVPTNNVLFNLRWDDRAGNESDRQRNRTNADVLCSVPDCAEPVRTGGLCDEHFRQRRREVIRRALATA